MASWMVFFSLQATKKKRLISSGVLLCFPAVMMLEIASSHHFACIYANWTKIVVCPFCWESATSGVYLSILESRRDACQ